jgi:tetratricopeptide repeat protein
LRPARLACLAAPAVLAAAAAFTAAAAGASDDPTWARDVAPLVYRRCAGCHHDGTVAPFALLEYPQARSHAKQMALVTAKRRMPPWLPAGGDVAFADDRRLSDEEIALLARWAELGAPEGDPAAAPPPPKYTEGWQLGEPDLVVQPIDAYTLEPEGSDVFRNLVVPLDLPAGKYVTACEMRPGSGRFVHHAVVLIDPAREGRRLDRQDGDPGFGGMDLHGATSPDGHFVGWAPGRTPRSVAAGMQWPLPARADLLIQLHLLPSGKPEKVLPQLGLHLTDQPPSLLPCIVRLGTKTLEIAPGDANYVVEDQVVLPVDVEALAIVPHAHRLGRVMEASAQLPDGRTLKLIEIPQWDFSWQDEYHFAQPVALPKGTTLRMHFTYDNSDANPRNPSHPPRKVSYGASSSDEMSDLWLQLLPRTPTDRDTLLALVDQKEHSDRVALMQIAFDRDGPTAESHYDLGTALFGASRFDEAKSHFEAALALDPKYVSAWVNLGLVHTRSERWSEARRCFEQVLLLDPRHENGQKNLALACEKGGDWKAAAQAWRTLLEQEKNGYAAQALAWILATAPDDSVRDGKAALLWARRAAGIMKDDPETLDVLAAAFAESGKWKDAILTDKRAIEAAEKAGADEAAKRYAEHQKAYREKRAWRDAPAAK